MRLIRFKAQDMLRGSRSGTYTVLLTTEGRKWARIVYIDASGLAETAVPIEDLTKWGTDLHTNKYWGEKKAIKYFLNRGKEWGITKALKRKLKARLIELKGEGK